MDMLSTDAVEPGRRFDFWSEVVCRTFVALDCAADQRDRFRGAVRRRVVGRCSVVRVEAGANRVVRSRELVRRAPGDDLIVMLQARGTARVSQGERRAVLAPGAAMVLRSDEPYAIEFPQTFGQYVLKVPSTAGAIAPGPTGMRFKLIRSIARDLLEPGDGGDDGCDTVAGQIFEALLAPGAGRAGPGCPDLFAMAREAVRDGIGDPLLDRKRVAAALGVSVRTLSRTLASRATTFEAMLWDARLDAAAAALATRHRRPSVTEVAAEFGFADASHLVRRYRERFGTTPGRALRS